MLNILHLNNPIKILLCLNLLILKKVIGILNNQGFILLLKQPRIQPLIIKNLSNNERVQNNLDDPTKHELEWLSLKY